MRVIVSDSSCLIDLRKASLLDTFLKLPYEFLIPNTLFEDELLKFTAAQKRALRRGGLRIVDLLGTQVLGAQSVVRQQPSLTIHDGLAFVLAQSHAGAILLTGDKVLRTFAEAEGIEVRGVLWLIDEIHRHGVDTPENLAVVLQALAADPTVRLPRQELVKFIRRYTSLR